MKKAGILALAMIAVIMISFSSGYYFGRNSVNSNIQVSYPETEAATVPSATEIMIANSSETSPSESISTGETGATTEIIAGNLADTDATLSPEEALININTAELDLLITLPGIGEVLGQRIIDYRNEHGAFSTVDELTNVSGIGPKRLEAILEYVTVGG